MPEPVDDVDSDEEGVAVNDPLSNTEGEGVDDVDSDQEPVDDVDLDRELVAVNDPLGNTKGEGEGDNVTEQSVELLQVQIHQVGGYLLLPQFQELPLSSKVACGA